MHSYWFLLGHFIIQGFDIWDLKWKFKPELAKGRHTKPERALFTKGIYLTLCTVLLLPPHPLEPAEILLHGGLILVFILAPMSRLLQRYQITNRYHY